MVNSAAFIEEQYGHLIDSVLVKEDLPSACNQLKAILEKLSTDSFWVPISWVRVQSTMLCQAKEEDLPVCWYAVNRKDYQKGKKCPVEQPASLG